MAGEVAAMRLISSRSTEEGWCLVACGRRWVGGWVARVCAWVGGVGARGNESGEAGECGPAVAMVGGWFQEVCGATWAQRKSSVAACQALPCSGPRPAGRRHHSTPHPAGQPLPGSRAAPGLGVWPRALGGWGMVSVRRAKVMLMLLRSSAALYWNLNCAGRGTARAAQRAVTC